MCLGISGRPLLGSVPRERARARADAAPPTPVCPPPPLCRSASRSNMAVVWMVEHGVFSKDVAQAMAPRYEEAKLAMKAMSVPTVAPTGSTTAKTVAKVVAQPAVDPGVSLGGDETVGRIGI